MSMKRCCSLCLTTTNEYENLRNDAGDFNDIYAIAVKYFDPKILKMGKKAGVLCQSCWLPIKYFNKFQQNVVKSRSLPEKTKITVQVEKQVDEIVYDQNTDDDYKSGDESGNYANSNDNAYVIPDSEANCEENDLIIKEEPMTPSLSEKTTLNNKNADDNNTNGDESSRINACSYENVEKAAPSSLLEKPLIKVECDDQADEIVNQKNTDDEVGNIACSYDKNHGEQQFTSVEEEIPCSLLEKTIIKVECDVQGDETVNYKNTDDNYTSGDEPDNEEQEFLSDDDDDALSYSKHNTINKSKPLSRKQLTNKQTKSGNIADTDEMHTQKKKIKLNNDNEKLNVEDCPNQNDKAGNSAHAAKKQSTKNAFVEKITFNCDVCGIELDSPVSLNNHMAVFHNDNSTIYVCSICGTIKHSAKAVLDHKKWVHEGQRKCSYCNKEFKNSSNLSEHVAMHTGHDLYQCPHCPQTFRVRSTLSVHRKRNHPIEFEKGKNNRSKPSKLDSHLAKKQVVV